jgi:L-asparaginase / beta-aspartyl-peptidase
MLRVAQALLSSLCFTLSAMAATPVFVIHGGAGVIAKDVTGEKEKAYRAELQRALEAGYEVLKGGGSSLDAVSKAIVIMEDSPLFNAGKGAVFNHDGRNELDASIMDGATARAGSVANVHRVKNPILLARAVMEKSPHVMLVGDGAEQFAQSIGMTLVDPKYFYTEERWQQLQEELKK